jgi:hypothetical protein
MNPRPRFAIPSLDQIIGVAACAGAAGPIFLLMSTIDSMVKAPDEVVQLWRTARPLPDLLRGCAMASLFALPIVTMIAIGAQALARRKHDSFMKSVACGSAIAFVATSIACEILLGTSPLSEPGNVRENALLALGSFIMSALYWLLAVRRTRNQRALAEQHERALRAME